MPGTATSVTVSLIEGTYLAKPVTAGGLEAGSARAVEYAPAGSGGGTLAASASPAVFNVETGLPSGTTAPSICSVGGGTGPFTYAWTTVSGGGVGVIGPTTAAARFTWVGMGFGSVVNATFVCTVTDSLGATAVSNVVSVRVSRSG